MKAITKETKRNCGISPLTALLMAAALVLALAGCLNPIAPPAPKAEAAASGAAQREPYTAAVYLGGDGEDADGRSIAGPTKERISLTGIRNYIQLIAVDKANKTIAGFYEKRGTGADSAVTLLLKGLATKGKQGG